MPLSLIWKVLASSFLCFSCFAQTDEGRIVNYKDQVVLYSDIGFSSAPFTVRYPFNDSVSRLNYKINYRPFIGIAGAYKWFSLRVSFPIMKGWRSIDKYGVSKQFTLGGDYTYKKTYLDGEYQTIRGYAIKNTEKWDSTYSQEKPNKIMPELTTNNVAINVWYFHDKDFKMSALHGKRAHYNKQVHTWYVKGTFNLFGIKNETGEIIPAELQQVTNSKTATSRVHALDFGVVPGYAYVNKVKSWQFSGWFGFGGVLQSKFYEVNGNTRGFLGLAPRYDIRVMGGYTNPKVFFFLLTDFDNKSMRFEDLVFRQYFYSIRLVGGYRFPKKESNKPKKVKD